MAAVERVTVNLKPRAVQALGEVATITGENTTDAINRALVLYGRLLALIEVDNAVVSIKTPDGETEQLWLL